ncbi:2-oxo acid dehydrogenase subunit E2 [Nocardia sp. NPDC059239]|uniref:2-oxo acid dehydrogenase subunit E2 n=1 Tax=Nocardia sp. NPDC059239 TaxID=3346785 RepID=UPI0036A123BF
MTTSQTTISVVLPSLGENVTEATITRWLKTIGDHIDEGEPLLEVATDKVDTEIPSPAAGVLLGILATEDTLVEVGGVLAQTAPDDNVVSVAAPPTSATTPTPVSAPARSSDSRSDRVEPLPRIRGTIAQRMVESLQTSAQLTTIVEVDITEVARLQDREKVAFHAQTGVKLSFLPSFVAAAVEALGQHPVINSSLNVDCTEVTYHGGVHLGMAVDSDKGLMVPVIREASGQSISQLARAVTDAADNLRSGKIHPDDLSGGTFTITDTGSRAALFDTPIINQPQSAILGLRTVVERLVPTRDDGGALQIGVRSMAYLSLSYDHRIVDGADATRYLTTVKHRLQNGFTPEDLR